MNMVMGSWPRSTLGRWTSWIRRSSCRGGDRGEGRGGGGGEGRGGSRRWRWSRRSKDYTTLGMSPGCRIATPGRQKRLISRGVWHAENGCSNKKSFERFENSSIQHFFKQLKPLQTANTQNHQKDQNLINFKGTVFYSKKSYEKLAKKLWLSNLVITIGYNRVITL